MDSLVFKKFDLKKRQVLDKLDVDIGKKKNEFSARGTLQSSMFIGAAYTLMSESARGNIDLLLDTYKEVANTTSNENFIIEKETEIRAEVEKLVAMEGPRCILI